MSGETPHSPETPAELTEREKVLVGVWENIALDWLISPKPHDPNAPKDLADIVQAISSQYGLPIDTVRGYESFIREQMHRAVSYFDTQLQREP